MTTKEIVGGPTEWGTDVWVEWRDVAPNGRPYTVRTTSFSHEVIGPTSWGWGSRHTERLAYDILLELGHCGPAAVILAPAFEKDVVAHLPESGFRLTESRVQGWIEHRADEVAPGWRSRL